MRKTLLLLLVCLLSAVNNTFGISLNAVEYTISGDEAYVSGTISGGPSGAITLESSVYDYKTEKYYPVTSIGDNALEQCFNLTQVVIPEGIVSIGTDAFYYCYSLEKVVLPSTLKTIGDNAFSSCYVLKDIVLPEGLTTIGNRAFNFCQNLTNINIPSTLTTLGSEIFSYCGFTTFTIPSTLKNVPESFLASCENLTTIIVEEGVETIEQGAFQVCYSLKNVTLPSSLKAIGSKAFYLDRELESIKIPSGVETISDRVFEDCGKLVNVDFSKATSLTTMGENVFTSCYTLKSVDFSACTSLKTMGKYMFYYCGELQSVKFPEGLETVDTGFFSNCSGLIGVSFPSSITDIQKYAFMGCDNLQYVDVSKCVLLAPFEANSWSYNIEIRNEAVVYVPDGVGCTNNGRENVIFGSSADKITISDNTIIPYDITVNSLTYTRSLSTSDDAYTICLPYNPPTNEDIKYYTLSSASSSALTFTEVLTPVANTPYLVVATATTAVGCSDETNVELKVEADNTATAGNYTMHGTLTGMSNADAAAAGAYILQSGNLWGKVTTENGGAYIPPFRAYITASGGAPANMFTELLDGETTGINSLRTIDADGTERWFDLNGRRLEGKPAQKGVYIQKGKKVIVK